MCNVRNIDITFQLYTKRACNSTTMVTFSGTQFERILTNEGNSVVMQYKWLSWCCRGASGSNYEVLHRLVQMQMLCYPSATSAKSFILHHNTVSFISKDSLKLCSRKRHHCSRDPCIFRTVGCVQRWWITCSKRYLTADFPGLIQALFVYNWNVMSMLRTLHIN
jgi:hypothetical protein